MAAPDIKNFTFEELKAVYKNDALPSFVAAQIFSWVYEKRVEDFDAMTDIAKTTRTCLKDKYSISTLRVKKEETSKDGTKKYLLALGEGDCIEAVVIPFDERATLCVSSQVGCKFGCAFCLSGTSGFKRNLSAAEIINQYLAIADRLAPRAITNIVFMGIGEPLDNFDAVVKSIRILTEPRGLSIPKRRVSLSTCGLTPQIEKLIGYDLGIKLSVSLHSADDELRTKIMPVNKKYPVTDLVRTLKAYSRNGRYPISFEYVMLPGYNMSDKDVLKLAALLKGVRSKLNLIPYNESSLDFSTPDGRQVQIFTKELKKRGVFFTLRKSRGGDIHAACGQLRAQR